MRKVLLIAAVTAFAIACGSPANTTNTNSPNSPASNSSTPSNTLKTAVAPASPLSSLKASVGKTAVDIKLWDNKDVGPRLEKLMGADYATMKKFWGTESPIKADGDILMMSGCEPHNCGDNQYVMFIDTARDNINVVHINKGVAKDYKEKGDITLPKEFADELSTLKPNK
jgi:hypothetical protein